jgi:hypothetical protein
MNIFDLLFIALFLAGVGTLLTALLWVLRQQFARALRVLRTLLICAAVYMCVVAISSLFIPRRVLSIGESECFDDWCIGVESSSPPPYVVSLRLQSRARRVPQRENNVVVYLTDSAGRRYDPLPDPSAVPFNVLLQPQESVLATRRFQTPANARDLGLVIAHEGGGFPIGWFIIGYETWFRKPAIGRLP